MFSQTQKQALGLPRTSGNITTIIIVGNIFKKTFKVVKLTAATKDRLSELETCKTELEISILQEQIQKPLLTKEQILFGIEKHKSLDLATKEGKQGLIDSFIVAIYLYDNKLIYTCTHRDEQYTLTLNKIEALTQKSEPTKSSDYIGLVRLTGLEPALFWNRFLRPARLPFRHNRVHQWIS